MKISKCSSLVFVFQARNYLRTSDYKSSCFMEVLITFYIRFAITVSFGIVYLLIALDEMHLWPLLIYISMEIKKGKRE